MLNKILLTLPALVAGLTLSNVNADDKPLPDKILKIMQKEKYAHSNWGLYVRDAETGQVLFDLNSDQLFSPASTSKLFSVAALIHAYGDDYRFKTPVYAVGNINNGVLSGSLVLVGQGDLTFGGRQSGPDKIEFTTLDHINANEVPGTSITPQDPLTAFKDLARQIHAKGINAIKGDVEIDDRFFETVDKRGAALSPILVNENLIDLVFNPSDIGQAAKLTWRPQIEGYTVKNEVKTVAKGGPLNIEIISDEEGKHIVVKGTLPLDSKDIVKTAPIKKPADFARTAFIEALRSEGISVELSNSKQLLPSENTLKSLQPITVWTSPPLSEYAKLILKVSHNTGANLVPLLLAIHEDKKTYDEGMLALGKFLTDVVKLQPNTFVFMDAAGGEGNRLTPQTEVQLLEYERKLPKQQFKYYYDAQPILGVDGSLETFEKNSPAAGKVHAKPGTGVSYNLATQKFFLTTQALAGYIDGKNGHLLEYMLVVNNATMPTIQDVFAIFEDVSEISSLIYENSL